MIIKTFFNNYFYAFKKKFGKTEDKKISYRIWSQVKASSKTIVGEGIKKIIRNNCYGEKSLHIYNKDQINGMFLSFDKIVQSLSF